MLLREKANKSNHFRFCDMIIDSKGRKRFIRRSVSDDLANSSTAAGRSTPPAPITSTSAHSKPSSVASTPGAPAKSHSVTNGTCKSASKPPLPLTSSTSASKTIDENMTSPYESYSSRRSKPITRSYTTDLTSSKTDNGNSSYRSTTSRNRYDSPISTVTPSSSSYSSRYGYDRPASAVTPRSTYLNDALTSSSVSAYSPYRATPTSSYSSARTPYSSDLAKSSDVRTRAADPTRDRSDYASSARWNSSTRATDVGTRSSDYVPRTSFRSGDIRSIVSEHSPLETYTPRYTGSLNRTASLRDAKDSSDLSSSGPSFGRSRHSFHGSIDPPSGGASSRTERRARRRNLAVESDSTEEEAKASASRHPPRWKESRSPRPDSTADSTPTLPRRRPDPEPDGSRLHDVEPDHQKSRSHIERAYQRGYNRQRAKTIDLSTLQSSEAVSKVENGVGKVAYGAEKDSNVETRAERIARYKEDRRRQLAANKYGERGKSSTDDNDNDLANRLRSSLRSKRGQARSPRLESSSDALDVGDGPRPRITRTTSQTTTASSALERRARRPESSSVQESSPGVEQARRPASAHGAEIHQSDSASSVTSRSSARSDRRRFIRRGVSSDDQPIKSTPDVKTTKTSPRTITVKTNDVKPTSDTGAIIPEARTKVADVPANAEVVLSNNDDVTPKLDDAKSSTPDDISAQLAVIEANLDARAKKRRDKATFRRSQLNALGEQGDAVDAPSESSCYATPPEGCSSQDSPSVTPAVGVDAATFKLTGVSSKECTTSSVPTDDMKVTDIIDGVVSGLTTPDAKAPTRRLFIRQSSGEAVVAQDVDSPAPVGADVHSPPRTRKVSVGEPVKQERRKSLKSDPAATIDDPLTEMLTKSHDDESPTAQRRSIEPVSILKNKDPHVGILKARSIEEDDRPASILKQRRSLTDRTVDFDDSVDDRPSHSILKRRESGGGDAPEIEDSLIHATSILRRRDDSCDSEDWIARSTILKKRDDEYDMDSKRSSEGEVKPCLKKSDSDSRPNSAGSSRRSSVEMPSGILKRGSDEMKSPVRLMENEFEKPKPILKRDRSHSPGEQRMSFVPDQGARSRDAEACVVDENRNCPVSILKRRDSEPEIAKPNLKSHPDNERAEIAKPILKNDPQTNERFVVELKPILKSEQESRGRSSSMTESGLRLANVGWRSFDKEKEKKTRSGSVDVGNSNASELRKVTTPAYCPLIGSQSEQRDEKLLKLFEERRMKEAMESDDSDGAKSQEALSAEEEIRQLREAALAAEGAGESKKMSVAERIFTMETKIEEQLYSPLRSRAQSGLATPSRKQERTVLSPRGAEAHVGESKQISDAQLLSRLSDMAEFSKSYHDACRQHELISKPVAHPTRLDGRPKRDVVPRLSVQNASSSSHSDDNGATTPDSSDLDSLLYAHDDTGAQIEMLSDREIEEAEREFDKLFDLNVDDDGNDADFHRLAQRAQKASRFDSSKLTIGGVTTGESSSDRRSPVLRNMRRRSRDFVEANDVSKASASLGPPMRSVVSADTIDASSKYDVGDRCSEAVPAEEIEKPEVSVSTRITQFSSVREKRNLKKKRDRPKTAPVDLDIIKQAISQSSSSDTSSARSSAERQLPTASADIADSKIVEVMTEIKELQEREGDEAQDNLTKLSLAEKMKLFSEQKEDEPVRRHGPIVKRKQRRQTTRFQTQPVTLDEVEKAAKISPLAMSMVKPPEPEMLAGMPIAAQRDICASHAEAILRRASADLTEKKSAAKQSPLAAAAAPTDASSQNSSMRGILKREGSFERTRKELTSRYRAGDAGSSSSGSDNSRSKSPSPESAKKFETSTNEAAPVILRRSSAADQQPNRDRYKSAPVPSVTVDATADAAPDDGETGKRRPARPVSQRHMTQPITGAEKKDAADGESDDMSKLSIAERVALLRKSGDEEWRKRVGKDDDEVHLRPAPNQARLKLERPKSIHDLKSQLEQNQVGWQRRVEQKDVTLFTAEGKRCMSGPSTPEVENSPLFNRHRRSPRANIVRLRCKDSDSSDTTTTPPFSPTSKLPTFKPPPAQSTSSSTEVSTSQTSDTSDSERARRVLVPSQDDSFFQRRSQADLDKQKVKVDINAFDDVFLMSQETLETTKKVKPKRAHRTKRNPLKALNERTDVQQEYIEVKNEAVEKELQKQKLDRVGAGQGLAESALAGLASTEKFSKVELKKVDATVPTKQHAHGVNVDPYNDLMLVQVKGRRHVQLRLVAPATSSLNSGDCFLLFTPERIFCWMGRYANVMEKAKAQEVANLVYQKRDLGFKGERAVQFLDEANSEHKHEFWNLLGGYGEYRSAGPENEDNLYELYMTESNIVYKVQGDSLVPLDQWWGQPLKYAVLDQKEVLLFDFGSELYVWNGRQCSFDSRKMALKLAKQLWQQGYDYTETEVNPLCPFLTEAQGGLALKSAHRPDWCVLGKINYNMETQLFKEKFSDWPDTSKIIRVKANDYAEQQKVEALNLKPYDAALLIKPSELPVSLVLEGSHVGRGRKWIDVVDETIKKEFDVVTIKVTCWHVLEYDHYMVPDASYGQFHEGDTYVVRWQYMVMAAGFKSMRGATARGSLTGRERCAYFFWQGDTSTVNEKGASALMTVELDEERGPQIRVVQGKEPPCFTALFDGKMAIHIGKREDETTNTPGPWRMYVIRNEIKHESYLLEVPCLYENLRSRSSFLVANMDSGLSYVWHGSKSPDGTRYCTMQAATRLSAADCPLEFDLKNAEKKLLKAVIVNEGRETSAFLAALKHSATASPYDSLLTARDAYKTTPRLFYMTSVSGVFEATEVLYHCRSDQASPLPFIQSHLYDAAQPALFLFDNDHEVYLWQGWWPEGFEEGENVLTGSATARFNMDRKLALQTTVQYCKEKNRSKHPRSEVVIAGHETLHFINLFPSWRVNQEAVTNNQTVFDRLKGKCGVDEILARYEKKYFSLEELLERPLVEGVDPSKIESYLNDDDFEALMGMNKDAFYAQPSWKQIDMKKAADLF